MAQVTINSKTPQQPKGGYLFITEEDRIIIATSLDGNALTGVYLDNGMMITTGLPLVSPVPPEMEIVLRNI
jgi:hypothetical protein